VNRPRFEDDDDWVGEPPEGRHTRDQPRPVAWRRQALAAGLFFLGLFVLAVVVVILAA
jgi:hypothetical protein